MHIYSATIGFADEDKYLIKSCQRAQVMDARARCFPRKDGTLIGLKTLIKETDNTSTIK